MTSETKKSWGTPTLQAIDMRATAVKGLASNESECSAQNNTQTGNCPNVS